MKKKLLGALLIAVTLMTAGRAFSKDDFEDAMLKAKKSLETAMQSSDESKILKARGQFERIHQLKKDPWLVNYYIALADYGLAMTGAATEDMKKIKQYTESGLSTLQMSIDQKADFADSYVLLKALNFNRWMYEQEKMQEIITATQNADEKASKLDPGNPRFVLLKGISSYWTPEAFGGGAANAVTDFEKSIELFSKRVEKSELYPDWGEDLSYGYLALSFIKKNGTGDLAKAKDAIDKGMEKFPGSGFLSAYVMSEYNKAKGN